MRNVLLTGVGGQGTVLAAKILAQAAQDKGWHVRTAETIGMAQRGGSVVSHVRMGDDGEEVFAPLVAHGAADLIIAFEPVEAARTLSYMSSCGVVVTAMTPIQPVSAALSSQPYRVQDAIEHMNNALRGSASRLVTVDDAMLLQTLGSRKVLNTLLLAVALTSGCVPLDLDDLRHAIKVCVRPRFVGLNLAAVDTVEQNIQ